MIIIIIIIIIITIIFIIIIIIIVVVVVVVIIIPTTTTTTTTLPFFAALYGALFTEHTEAAFANYRLWESAGFVMTYAYQNSLQTAHKLYVCLAFLGIGMLCYSVVEIMEKRKQRNQAEITTPENRT
jgi:hypothetical protein